MDKHSYYAKDQGLEPFINNGFDIRNTGGWCMAACGDTIAGFLVVTQEATSLYASEDAWCNGDGGDGFITGLLFDEVSPDDGWLSTPWAIRDTRDALALVMSAVNLANAIQDEDNAYSDDDKATELGACIEGVAWALKYLDKEGN